MLVTPHLPAWQYAGYAKNHANRINLILHVFTAPVFIAGALGCVFFLIQQNWVFSAAWFGAMLLVIVVQGVGHAREREKPEPFLSPLDFIARFFTENFFTFWRFVFSGQWLAAWKNTSPEDKP